MTATILYPSQCYLGEGPLWHPERKTCFWVDIEEKKFYEYKWQERTVQCRTLEYRVTFIVQDKDNNLVLGLEGGIARYDLSTEKLTWLIDIEKDMDKHRCNDGKVDKMGRLWLGTLHRDFHKGTGSLYCIDEKLQLTKKQTGFTIANGLAWSPDNTVLYFIDSPTNKVKAFRYDEGTAQTRYDKDVIDIPHDMGSPDGMAIDEEGMLWIAHWGGSGVYRWDPVTGKLIDKIAVPAPNVSSCAFVGDNLDHLLITTARQDLNEEDLKKYPESGDVFIQQVNTKGTLPNKCNF
jgi:sugar lactone lactonase YvrE